MYLILVNILQILGLLITLSLLVYYFYLRHMHGYWKRRGIPTAPGGHWLFGHFKDAALLRKQPGLLVADIYRSSSDKEDFLGLYFLHQPFLLVRNPKLIKYILIKDFLSFPNHHFSPKNDSDIIGSSNLFNTTYPDWKYLRIKLSPVFTSGKIKKLFFLMVETSENMKQHFEKQFINGVKTKPLRVREIIAKYATDIIASLAFGVKSNSFTEEQEGFYLQSLEAFKITVFRALRFYCAFFFPNLAKYLSGKILGSATDYFRDVFWSSMNAREASNTTRGDVIDFLIELKNEPQDSPFKFEGDTLAAQSTVFFVAGRETTVTTVTFALWELAKNPDIQKRTRAEIYDVLEKHGMTYEGVMGMKYLFQVMFETVRLYPPAPILDRRAVNDYKVPDTDITIEKGTPIYISVQGLHSDSKYHPNPTLYDPDRFSEERKTEIEQCSYLPFGEGPRVCIAMRVGLLQTAVALITILKDYEVTLQTFDESIIDPRNVFTAPLESFALNFRKLVQTE